MKSYSGPVFLKEGFVQGRIDIEEGNVIEFEEGGDKGEESLIIPSLVNAHTHSGDAFVEKAPEGTIEEVVGPGGFKHKALEESTDEIIIQGIRRFFTELKNNGVTKSIEFREGGIKGIRLLNKAVKRLENDIKITIFGRPAKRTYNEQEINKLTSIADGIGLSSYRDWDKIQFHNIAEAARRSNTPLALHCSEDVKEPLDRILDFDIHHLIHMLEADEDDLFACSSEDIPIVICPRSNMQFGKIPNIPLMIKNDVKLSLGTDNAMLVSPNMFREMEVAYRVGKIKGGVKAKDILKMSTWNPRESLYHTLDVDGSKSDKDTFLVLERKGGEPAHEVVTKTSIKNIKRIVMW